MLGVMVHIGPAASTRFDERLEGTIAHLMICGQDGRLHLAAMYGKPSVARPGSGCQRTRHEREVIRFVSPTWSTTLVLHVPYLAGQAVGGDGVTVTYGASAQQLTVQAGLHDAYPAGRGRGGSG